MNELMKGKGFLASGMLNVSPKEAFELCRKGAILVDVREETMNHFKIFDVENIMFCPFSTMSETLKEIPNTELLIFADSTGLHSKEAVKQLAALGFENIANMPGGIVDWERAGLPVRIDKKERLSGSCMCQLRPREKKQ